MFHDSKISNELLLNDIDDALQVINVLSINICQSYPCRNNLLALDKLISFHFLHQDVMNSVMSISQNLQFSFPILPRFPNFHLNYSGHLL